MHVRLAAALAIAVAAALPARADAPAQALRVATDIPPVHSLVARIMQGVGEPALILPPGASPHGYAMRPSEAAALADAEVIVWMGDALTPWLGRAIGALAPDAVSLALLYAEGTSLLGLRDGATFAQHAHAEETGDKGVDPHAWLDPENAKPWLAAIAKALAEADPANAAAYARNAAEGQAELDELTAELSRVLAPVRGQPFVVAHDAYHYFERRFAVEAAAAILPGDAAPPSPARISEIRKTVRDTAARCVFVEPQFARRLVETVTDGTGARTATLDPLGATLRRGAELYPKLMRGLAAGLRDCLAAQP